MREIDHNPILTKHQKTLLAHFKRWSECTKFYITGGTALSAFYLRHRLSEDLDFFFVDEVEIEPILTFLRSLPEIQDLNLERKFDRKIFIIRYEDAESLKVEFTKYPFKTIKPFKKVEGIQVDSVLDILANKLMALTDRKEAKDYVDVYFILKESPNLSVDEMIEMTEQKFGIKGLVYILQRRFLEGPEKGVEFLNMKKDCQGKEMAVFFKGLARKLIKKSVEAEKQ